MTADNICATLNAIMPSVLDQKFQHKLLLGKQYFSEIELYCRREIGYRTYYMKHYRGGKQWRIANALTIDSKVIVELNDDSHAIVLALKYAN